MMLVGQGVASESNAGGELDRASAMSDPLAVPSGEPVRRSILVARMVASEACLEGVPYDELPSDCRCCAGEVRMLVRWNCFRFGVEWSRAGDGSRYDCRRGVLGIAGEALAGAARVEALEPFFGERNEPTSNKAERGELFELDDGDEAVRNDESRAGTVSPLRAFLAFPNDGGSPAMPNVSSCCSVR